MAESKAPVKRPLTFPLVSGASSVTAPGVSPGAEAGLSPLDFMLTLLRDEEASLADRKWAAEKAAPYCHSRLGTATGGAEDAATGHEAALDALD